MMLGLPWWAWLVLVAAGAAFLLSRAARSWRTSFRREFLDYVRREAPELEVVAEREREIDVRQAGETGTLRLDRMFAEGSRLPSGDTAARDALFAHFVKMLREGASAAALDPQRDRARVRPRVVRDTFVAALRAEMKGQDHGLPALPSGVPGLSVVLVLDNESSVAYLTDEMLADLALSPEEALAVAKENLARTFDASVVRGALESRSVNVVKSLDTYDAARVLLVSDALREGEEVAAMIPDRDTLVVTGVPADGDWAPLRKLARTPAGDPLWAEPLLVRKSGVSPAPAGH